jgi:hypothetical protein
MEIRAAMRWTRRATDAEMGLAHDLHTRLPSLFERFAQGLIDRRRAERLVSHTSHLSVGHARQVVDSLLDDAHRWTTGQLVERIRRACLEIDPDTAKTATKNPIRIAGWWHGLIRTGPSPSPASVWTLPRSPKPRISSTGSPGTAEALIRPRPWTSCEPTSS